MAHIQKVTLPSGKIRWRARWKDAGGKPQSRNFDTQTAAKAFLKTAEAGGGGSSTNTLLELAREHGGFFEGLIKNGVRERITLDGYSSVLNTHLKPDGFAKTKLCDLTTPLTQDFLDRLVAGGASVATVKKVRRTLVIWCEFGQRKGWLVSNPAMPCKVEETARLDEEDGRVQIPSKEQVRVLLEAAASDPRDKAAINLLTFGGFRISELLGAADEAIVLAGKTGRVKVRERLDSRHGKLGPLKSKKARRDVPIHTTASVATKEWRLARGPTQSFLHTNGRGETKRVPGRLFNSPDGGQLWTYQEFVRDCWRPVMFRAGLLEMVRDQGGTKRPVPAFTPHDLRHVAASLWIAQRLSQKKVQELMGHASLKMTMDLYGHLWADEEEDEALAAGSEALIYGATARSPRGQ